MSDKTPQKAIIVLTPGRSGSSLLMQLLGKMGMSLSDELIPGKYENIDGYFEDKEIVDIHRELLKQLNTAPYLPLPNNWLESQPSIVAKKKLLEVVGARLEKAETIWGVKDPRISVLLPLWNSIFNRLGIVPIFVAIIRNPSAVANSMKRHTRRNEALTELQWLLRVSDLLYYSAGDCFIVHYEDLLQNPKEISLKLLDYTGLNQYFIGDIEEAIQGIVKPNRNRVLFDSYQVENRYVRELYDVIKGCNGQDFDRIMVSDAVKESREIMHGFQGWAMEVHKVTAQKNTLEKKLDALKEGNTTKTTAFDEKISDLRSENQKLLTELSILKDKKVSKNTVLEEKISDLRSENQKLLTELSVIKNQKLSEIKGFEDKIRKVNEEKQKELADLTLKNSNQILEIKDLRDEVHNLRLANNSTQRQLLQTSNVKKEGNKKKYRDEALILMEKKAFDRNAKLNKEIAKLNKEIARHKKRVKALESSTAYRTGEILVSSILKPGKNTIMLPFRLVKLTFSGAKSRLKKTRKNKI